MFLDEEITDPKIIYVLTPYSILIRTKTTWGRLTKYSG